MIRPGIGDLVAVHGDGKFYYALILTRIRLAGAPLVFVFHTTSSELLQPAEVLKDRTGFHAFIDFIYAKREKRISRVGTKIDIRPFGMPKGFKTAPYVGEDPPLWTIWDAEMDRIIRRTRRLSEKELDYPLSKRTTDAWMRRQVDRKWLPHIREVYDA